MIRTGDSSDFSWGERDPIRTKHFSTFKVYLCLLLSQEILLGFQVARQHFEIATNLARSFGTWEIVFYSHRKYKTKSLPITKADYRQKKYNVIKRKCPNNTTEKNITTKDVMFGHTKDDRRQAYVKKRKRAIGPAQPRTRLVGP
jgi:hypothetical protein